MIISIISGVSGIKISNKNFNQNFKQKNKKENRKKKFEFS